MRWEDERYVRVYTRDTTDWVALGWEAQSLFVLTMRKVDRAGILDLGKSGVRGLAALVAMPLEVVQRALPTLVEDGCVKLTGSVLVLPNFIEAQEAKQSDAQRKREQRARDRDLASAGVTNCDHSSRNVTGADTSGGVASISVTPNCAVPSRTEEALSPALAREGESPELDPAAADAATPPAAEAAAGSIPKPHERTVEKPGEPETIAPASPRPLPPAVDADPTGTALPGAPAEAPGADPAPPPAGHSAEGGTSSATAEDVPPPPRSPLGLDQLREQRDRDFPALAALFRALEAEAIVLTWPKQPRGMNADAVILGQERALEVMRRAYAKAPAPYGGFYAVALHEAAALLKRRMGTQPPPAPPALDQAWLESLTPEARAEAEREWPELVQRVRHAAWPDALPQQLEAARQGLMARLSAGGAP